MLKEIGAGYIRGEENRWPETLGLICEVVPDVAFQPMSKQVEVSYRLGAGRREHLGCVPVIPETGIS